MVIKILQNSASFDGIDYSDKKTEKGEGNLLAAENFPFSDMTAKDYNDYLVAQSDLNKRVKNKQFHVSISTKGREHNFEQLTTIAKNYLEHMGYKNNPYLIYAHKDSPNNHVHIVTSRIDENGNKISDSLEKVRTQKFIKNELNINFSKDVDASIKEAFKYRFKKPDSLAALLKNDGYKTRITKGEFEVIKSGNVQARIPSKKIKDHIYFSQINFKEKNAIKAKMYKYSTGTNFDSLKKSLHENFGLQIAYQYNNNNPDSKQSGRKRNVVDYNLIDHNKKVIYNSEQLLSLEVLREKFSSVISKEELAHIIHDIKTNPIAINELKSFFNGINLKLNYNGDINLPSGTNLMRLDSDTLEKVKYKQRIFDIDKLEYSSNISSHILAKIYKVDLRDIDLSPADIPNEKLLLYKEIALSKLARNKNSLVNDKNIKIYQSIDGPILLDYKDKIILNLKQDLNIKIDTDKMIPLLKDDTMPIVDYSTSNTINIPDIYTEDLNTGDQKKKKRKRQININQ